MLDCDCVLAEGCQCPLGTGEVGGEGGEGQELGDGGETEQRNIGSIEPPNPQCTLRESREKHVQGEPCIYPSLEE